MQECLIQRGLRGYADPRLTKTCLWAEQSCAGALPGDLREQALFAQHETDQVTVELFRASPLVTPKILAWEGGVPSDVSDAGVPDATK